MTQIGKEYNTGIVPRKLPQERPKEIKREEPVKEKELVPAR